MKKFIYKKGEKKQSKKIGMALLIAVIATSALLLASIVISDIAFKQQIISYSWRESKIAFYAADSGIECALYYDLQVDDFFNTPDTDPLPPEKTIYCGDENNENETAQVLSVSNVNNNLFTSRFFYNLDSESCVIVDVIKTRISGGGQPVHIDTKITSRGYNTRCEPDADGKPEIFDGPRNVERALEVTYLGG